ncbi:hypothetical protein MLD38_021870 [Melastoma candidum]|uniref:Uncharacterized protein n=1 Tax=Melastoma candidum TaxID=119954 RepID=A0ACB9QQJ2_9MYRT|nr:hypothetical protein MLD38_021870 [Melastoma candidum]
MSPPPTSVPSPNIPHFLPNRLCLHNRIPSLLQYTAFFRARPGRPPFPTHLFAKSQHGHRPPTTTTTTTTTTQEDGIPADDVKFLVKFKSRYNYIRVLEVSRRADHPFAGSRLLLLDNPGNIHSISFLLKSFTGTYFDVFATLPPILPPGPIAVLGFGAGSAAKLLLELYPWVVVHGWELDPFVIDVAREYFGLSKVEQLYKDRIFVYVGDALRATVRDGFAGIVVDLFSRGVVIPELQDPDTWRKLKRWLREGGRVMVNVGGSCVEAEDKTRDGRLIMEDTLKAMREVFGEKLFVLTLGNRKEDSSLAFTGDMPDAVEWKKNLPKTLKGYVDMWAPCSFT